MDSAQKKGINFDLDTIALQIYYPKSDWHNAYYDVRAYFERNGFEHIQGSGYHSHKAMSEAKAMTVIYQMTKEFPWLNECVGICTISDVPELYDISHVFEREAQRLRPKEQ
ncbi:Uncharacterised protein [uncultured Roseburia sp.]|uniref:Virulence factor n=1 Tax=Brotonthovivens ammoniilytica TaxID=2981725 RepID=A0ABT2TLB6_9FIRM|nr:hypothetical protein [Brotonthovivens ammoniilytica]MCU6762999.1 hypothetical protein [Brotonthovivens ammoniilytica]SCI99975.1 Uncharacterised protein [uncultured Roseburia sp.]